MLAQEIIQKVKRIEITTHRLVNDVLSGQYKTRFKGHGIQFSEHRVYLPGDDVRHIDWKVSARSKEPLLKKYEEERELTVFLVVDLSNSFAFGSSKVTKHEMAAEIAAILAYAASRTGDRVGVLLFAGEVIKIIPPKRGKLHVQRIIRELLTDHPEAKQGTALTDALEATGNIMKHSGVIFVMSDFLAEGYEIALKRLSRKHDVVCLWMNDIRESEVPAIGTMRFRDPETGIEQVVDTRSYAFRSWLSKTTEAFESKTTTSLKRAKVETIRIKTQEDYVEAVIRFFQKRSRK